MMAPGVPLPVRREMDEESRRKNDRYLLATEAIVSGVARDGELTSGGDLDLAFYFENRKETAAAAERMFDAIRAYALVEKRKRLTSFEFGDKTSPQLPDGVESPSSRNRVSGFAAICFGDELAAHDLMVSRRTAAEIDCRCCRRESSIRSFCPIGRDANSRRSARLPSMMCRSDEFMVCRRGIVFQTSPTHQRVCFASRFPEIARHRSRLLR